MLYRFTKPQPLKLAFYIARRYFVTRKSQHVINIISWTAMAGIAIGTAGLVIVLSVFNGFSDLVTGLYDAFDPDIKITAAEGKVFDPADAGTLSSIPGVGHISHILEENALVKYRDRQAIATVKGVDDQFAYTSDVDRRIADGAYILKSGGRSFALVGTNLAYTLGMNLDDVFSPLDMYVPKKGNRAVLLPEQAFTNLAIRTSGVYAIQQDFDSKYIITPIEFVRDLTGEATRVSALELSLDEGANAEEVKSRIAKMAGSGFLVRDRMEQHDFLNKIFLSEKWAIYMILGFILLIAAFSIVGSVTMLVIEKKQDIATLRAMGCPTARIRRVFLLQGTLIGVTGGAAGLLLGGLVAWAQQTFGLIRIGNSEAFLIDIYPVAMQAPDFLASFLLVSGIALLLSWLTTQKVIGQEKVIPVKA